MERWGPPRREAVCSQCGNLWAKSNSPPALRHRGPPKRDGLGRPTCWIMPILSPASRSWGLPKHHGSCSKSAQFRANADFVPWFEALRNLPNGRVSVVNPPTCRPHQLRYPGVRRWGPPSGGGYGANPRTWGPTLIVSPALKHWGPPKARCLCPEFVHLWAISDLVTRS